MKYRIYIDEVGNPDLKSSDDPNHRFLSLTGVILELGYVEKVVHPQMEALKHKFFRSHPDEPVIFHRKEMHNARPPFEVLRNPEIRERFDSNLLTLLSAWEFTVITVCLDKKKHKEKYTKWQYDPYHYCLEVLLERYYFFLDRKKAKGDVMAESRGGKENQRLMNSFARLWEKGGQFIHAELFQKVLTSRELKVRPKINNVSGLQLADLLASESRNELLKEKGFLAKDLSPFAQRVTQILQSKFDQEEGQVYGKKFL